jgi:hypothetical protein
MPKLADIFERFGPAYLSKYATRMLPSHHRALQDILNCHTDALGGSVHICRKCKHKHFVFHSCRNRACPKCHRQKTDLWAEQLRHKLLPVPHFHLVFTLPAELRTIVRSNQRVMYGVLMKSAFSALKTLAGNKRFAGGKIGAVAVLHTWSRSMEFHPHVHMMVPAGALSNDGQHWIRGNSKYFVPIQALKTVFRAVFVKNARKALPEINIPKSIWRKKWSIHSNAFEAGPENLINYLARYVYRVAISANRIKQVTTTGVTFKGYRSSITLSGEEFIRRFLQHVPPRSFHKVRYFGIMHPAYDQVRRRIKVMMLPESSRCERPAEESTATKPVFCCRVCGCEQARIMTIRGYHVQSRAPT